MMLVNKTPIKMNTIITASIILQDLGQRHLLVIGRLTAPICPQPIEIIVLVPIGVHR